MSKISKQISLGIDPLTGKRIRKWIYGTSPRDLKQAEKEAIAKFAKEGNVSNITYKDYEKKWYEAYRSNVQPHTAQGYKSILKRSIPLHHRKLKDILKTDLQKIINDSWDTPSVCIRYSSMMKQLWDCAISDGICSKNVACGLKLPKAPKTDRRPLTKNELSGIKQAEFDPLERFMMDILTQFGLRPGEAYALNKQSFDRKSRTLTINKAVGYDHNKAFLKPPKNEINRVLPVPDNFWEKIPNVKTMYFFVEEDGQLFRRHKANKFEREILKKINKAMGGTDQIKVTDMTFYNCRHHKASLLYYLPGVSLKKKAEYMGHTEKMFIQIYSHMMEEKEDVEALREAVNL